MKEAHVHSDTSVTIHDAPIPEITHPSQILVRVVVSGTNPKVSKQSNLPVAPILTFVCTGLEDARRHAKDHL